MFRTNVPAVMVWQHCCKPVAIGMAGAMPTDIETTEISKVCEVFEVALKPPLLRRIRHLHSAWRGAVIDDLQRRAKTK